MLQGLPKISVLIISYKQEELIKRAIDSLLAQKDYIYEICISDDCSPDRTWEVLQNYDKQYPGLFNIHQNSKNVGIFENIEQSWKLPKGDIIYQLAGDDECGAGWFKSVIDYIIDNKIDYKNELFCVYGDYEVVFPNRDTIIFKNNLVKSNYYLLGLALRGLISNRSTCFSINVLRKFENVSMGRSHIAELIQDRQLQVFCEHNYYISKTGNRYYAEIGVSSSMNINTLKEREQIRPYALQMFDKWNVRIDQADRAYMLLQKERLTARLSGCSNRKIRMKYAIKAFKFRLLFSKNRLKRFVFLCIRKIPHNTPLHLYY